MQGNPSGARQPRAKALGRRAPHVKTPRNAFIFSPRVETNPFDICSVMTDVLSTLTLRLSF